MLSNKRKEEIMNGLIDHLCEGWGVTQAIEVLKNVADVTNEELIELDFDIEDVQNYAN